MRSLSVICLTLSLCITHPAYAVPSVGGLKGQVIVAGAPPFSENWGKMVQRDNNATPRIGGPERAQEVKAKPFPSVVRFRGPGGEAVPPRAAAIPSGPFAAPGVLAPQTVTSGFLGSNLLDEINTIGGFIPPDTMGAIGPNHFVETINSSIAIYDRTGHRLSHVSLDSFFTVTVGNTTYPQNGTSDPRILFDRRSNRWFACVLEFGNPSGANNNIILAICRTSDPLAGTWDKYVIPVAIPRSGRTSFFNDFDTLGVDDNGVYFGMRVFPTSGADFAKIAATGKASLIAASPSLGAVFQWSNITDMWSSPQPAHNQDAITPGARAWFVASSDTALANINYRTLMWSRGTPTLSVTSVLATPGYNMPLDAPASGSSVPINIGDDRLAMAVIRNNKLWTCRNVGLDSSGGSTDSSRCGCEWLKLDVSSATPALLQSGRAYDPAATDPRSYYYPSIMVNGQDNAAMAFSGSKSTEFVGAYTCGRLSADPAGTMGAITAIKAGQASYQRVDTSNRNRWGDYSYTTLDPNDDMSIWTIQEYASNIGSSIWSTWVTQLLSPPPTLNNPNGSGCPGHIGFSLPLTGTGFYDPGPGYANRLTVQLTGGAVNGISNYNVIYSGPTSVNVTFDISVSATPGTRDIVLTSPDGQSATVTADFTVLTPVAITGQPVSLVKSAGTNAAFSVTASGSGLTYQWKRNGSPIGEATLPTYSITGVTTANGGTYTCVVSGACTAVISNPAALTVLTSDGSIGSVKSLADGSTVMLGNKGLYLKWPTFAYIEEPMFSAGIRLQGSLTANEGDKVCLIGTLHKPAGAEAFIDVTTMTPAGTIAIPPVAANGRTLNIPLIGGLYVSAIGAVKAGSVTANSFVVSDGADNIGIRVITQGSPGVTDGQFLQVSGAAGLDAGRVIYKK